MKWNTVYISGAYAITKVVESQWNGRNYRKETVWVVEWKGNEIAAEETLSDAKLVAERHNQRTEQ